MNNHTFSHTIIVTAVGCPPGLNTLRALKELNRYNLIAADADKYSPALYKYSTDNIVLIKASDEASYIKDLKKILCKKKVSVLIPCIEDEIFVIAKHADELRETGVKFMVPGIDVLNVACNKGHSTVIANKNGISCPLTTMIHNGTDMLGIERIVNAFMVICPFPWILKPAIGHGMNGVNKVGSKDEALNLLNTIDRDVVLQELIPGSVGSMYLVGLLYDKNGKAVRKFSSRSIRTLFASGGPATAGISVYSPDLIEKTEHLLGSIGRWHGPAAVEWMLDPRDNSFKYIEINPRFWGYSYLAVGSGINFPSVYVELCLDQPVGLDPGFKEGVTMLRITEDLIFETCPFRI
jgi:D-aspartate ligase